MPTEAVIVRRVPEFRARLTTRLSYEATLKIMTDAFQPYADFDSLLAFGFRYSGRLDGATFWLRRVTDETHRQNPTVVRGALAETEDGAEITLCASNPHRSLLNRAVASALELMTAMVLLGGTSLLYRGAMMVVAVACVTAGWYRLVPWRHGLGVMRDLAALLDSASTAR
jgi:hypothetical protein